MPTRDCMHCGGFYAAVVSETPPFARRGPCCCWRRKALSLSGDCGSPCRSCWRSRDSDGRDPRMQARDRTADVGDRGDEPDQHLRELILEAWSAGKQEEIATRHALTAKRLRGANATQPMAPLIAFSHPNPLGFPLSDARPRPPRLEAVTSDTFADTEPEQTHAVSSTDFAAARLPHAPSRSGSRAGVTTS